MVQNQNREVRLPNGQTATWDESLQRYVMKSATLAEDKATEIEQLARLRKMVIKRMTQLLAVVFFSAVFLVLNMVVSISDHFENYVAKPVAQGIGLFLEVLVQALLLVIAIGIAAAMLFDYGRAQKRTQREVPQTTNLNNVPGQPIPTKPSKQVWLEANKSDAQKLI